jgi:hypothetical protein
MVTLEHQSFCLWYTKDIIFPLAKKELLQGMYFCLSALSDLSGCKTTAWKSTKFFLDFFPVPEDIFSSLCMDFLELEPCKGQDGKEYNYVLVIVCRLEWLHISHTLPESWTNSYPTSPNIFGQMCLFHGYPNEIVSDQDHLISSKFFSTLCSLIGIEQHFAIIYRPKGKWSC